MANSELWVKQVSVAPKDVYRRYQEDRHLAFEHTRRSPSIFRG